MGKLHGPVFGAWFAPRAGEDSRAAIARALRAFQAEWKAQAGLRDHEPTLIVQEAPLAPSDVGTVADIAIRGQWTVDDYVTGDNPYIWDLVERIPTFRLVKLTPIEREFERQRIANERQALIKLRREQKRNARKQTPLGRKPNVPDSRKSFSMFRICAMQADAPWDYTPPQMVEGVEDSQPFSGLDWGSEDESEGIPNLYR